MKPITVVMHRDRLGGWAIELSGRRAPLTCETFDEARRVAYLCTARGRPCEILVCDAYDRVVHREFIDGANQESWRW